MTPDRLVPLGATGLHVTELGLGLGPIGGLFADVDDEHARATIDRGWEHGLRLFDTAPLYGYGRSEQAADPHRRTGVPARWRDDLARLAGCANVVAKLSGLVTEADWAAWTPKQIAPAVDAALAEFGADRLLWGSDWPVVELAGGYRRWLETARALVPVAAHPAVFGGAAAGTYGIIGEGMDAP